MKGKLKGAETGHSLLKRKSEALTKRFREITRRIDEAKRKMGRVMQIAAFSLAEVTYAVGGDIGYQIQESVKAARFRVRTKQENVSGVFLPQFESYMTEGNNDFAMTGLGKGGQQVQRCRETYARAVETLVELASLQVGVENCEKRLVLIWYRQHSSFWTRLSRWSTEEVSPTSWWQTLH
jgi:V-type H+-transporting ATPase subunit D